MTRARAIEVRLELCDEVGGVEVLRQGQRTSSAVASDGGVERRIHSSSPLSSVGKRREMSATKRARKLGQLSARSQNVVDIDESPQDGAVLLVGVEADVDGRAHKAPRQRKEERS